VAWPIGPVGATGTAGPSRWRRRRRRTFRWATGERAVTPRRGSRPAIEGSLHLFDRVPGRGLRRRAVQRGLDLVDGVGPSRRPVVDDRRQDRRLPIVRRNPATGPAVGAVRRTAGIVRTIRLGFLAHALSRGPARVIGRLIVAPFVIQWPCGRRCVPSADRGSPWAGVPRRAHTT
jgi:hypothetical protein